MNKILTWMNEAFQDVDGYISSKRLVTFLATVFMFGIAVGTMVWKLTVPQYMFDDFRDIVLVGVGFVGAEKFTSRPYAGTDTSGQ